MRYLDSSAIVKLVVDEVESAALRKHVLGVGIAASALASVESRRAIYRVHGDTPALQRLADILDAAVIIDVDAAVLRAATHVRPATLRSLDAIHVATALLAGESVDAMVTYDHRMAEAAEMAGLRVLSPR